MFLLRLYDNIYKIFELFERVQGLNTHVYIYMYINLLINYRFLKNI